LHRRLRLRLLPPLYLDLTASAPLMYCFCTAEYAAYMFKYDTVHGRFKGTVTHDAENVIVNGKSIRVFNNMNVSEQHG
jgi:hypothetical protein